MQKDFDAWNNLKKHTQHRQNKLYHERQIWWCSLGVNIGSEQDGSGMNYQRPVLILKAVSKTTCLVIPLTTSHKNRPFRIAIGSVTGRQATALLTQMRLIDTKRLMVKITTLDIQIFKSIRKAVRDLF